MSFQGTPSPRAPPSDNEEDVFLYLPLVELYHTALYFMHAERNSSEATSAQEK